MSDVDQSSNEATVLLHFLEHGENSMVIVDCTIGSDLLSTDGDAKNLEPYIGMESESDLAARAFYNGYLSAWIWDSCCKVSHRKKKRRGGFGHEEVRVFKRESSQ